MIDENTKAILLLTSYFGKSGSTQFKPLSVVEYGRFALWLHTHKFTPASLFHHFNDISDSWHDPNGKITTDRIKALLDRGVAMSLALEKWQRAGIWIVSRMDTSYPKILKRRLAHNAPAFFYGVGNKKLLKQGGIAIVGSRGISEIEESYTSKIARQAAREKVNVISGGARGVDETAMISALEASGTAVGVMADSLLKASTSSKWRSYLAREKLVLISSYYPEAGFNIGNAMARNKYIYCMSNFALTVRADEGKGGTWTGAKENLKEHWVPLFVRGNSNASGNKALLEMGATPLSAPPDHSKIADTWLLNLLEKTSLQPEIEKVKPIKDMFSASESNR